MTNKKDLERYRKLTEFGCVCCKQMGFYSVPEIHHIVDRGYRKHSGGNDATLPLCPAHHRGYHPLGVDLGPSLSEGSKLFEKAWGTERELLKMVNEAIA